MATIDCPHCHKEISDCPYCGASLAAINADDDTDTVVGADFADATAIDAKDMEIEEESLPRIKLGELQRELSFGIGFSVCGVLGLIASVLLMKTPATGILLLLVSVLTIVLGMKMIIGHISADCLQCGKKMKLLPNAREVSCDYCKTVYARKGNYLEVVQVLGVLEEKINPEQIPE